jgi:hypothetical protein
MSKARRISASDAHEAASRGDAILVCAYDDEAKCDRVRLQGALTMTELRTQQGTLPKDARLLFYCA